MKFMSVSFSLAMILGLALVVPSTLLNAQQSNVGTEGGTQEVVLGRFTCSGPASDGPIVGSVNINFKGTRGIFQEFFELLSDLAPDSPFEICDTVLPEFAASVRSLGCTVSKITTHEPFNTRFGGFVFVCDGRRNQLINVIAELAKQIINIDEVVP